jgi:hypothetical protein
MIRVEVTGTDQVLRGLARISRLLPGATRRAERSTAQALRARVIQNARPFRRTGGYERSIQVEGNVVFTNHPAALRLENGFIGTDALGRTYAQAPRKHWRPAMEPIQEILKSNLMEELDGNKR